MISLSSGINQYTSRSVDALREIQRDSEEIADSINTILEHRRRYDDEVGKRQRGKDGVRPIGRKI
jgi:hypothetical protein